MTVGVYKLGELKYVKYCSIICCWYCQNFDDLLMKTLCYSLYSIQFKTYLKLGESCFMWEGNGGGQLNCYCSSSPAGLLLGPKRRRNPNFVAQYGDPGWKGIKWYGHLEQKRTTSISEFKVTVYNLYVAWLQRPRKCIRGLEHWFHWVYLLTLSYFNFK